MKNVTSKIFIRIIILMSALGLIDVIIFQYNINEFSKYFSIATSIIGLTGVMLYYKKIDFFKYFILLWIVVQFVEFSEYLINAENVKYWKAIYKSKQLFEFQIGKSFDINNLGYKLELNLVPFLYLVFYQTLRMSSYRGKFFETVRFRDNNEFMPNAFVGNIIDQFTLGNENKSFLVKLNSSITYSNDITYDYCVISDFKSSQFGLERNLNLNLYLISNDKIIKDLKIKIEDLKYIDWIEGRITNPNTQYSQ